MFAGFIPFPVQPRRFLPAVEPCFIDREGQYKCIVAVAISLIDLHDLPLTCWASTLPTVECEPRAEAIPHGFRCRIKRLTAPVGVEEFVGANCHCNGVVFV